MGIIFNNIILFFVILFISGCGKKEISDDSLIEKNGIKYLYDNKSYTGPVSNKYKNNQIMYEGNYLSGKKNEQWIYYFENGKIKRESNYLDGKKHGSWIYYNKTGNIDWVQNYNEGKRDGEWLYYNKLGNLRAVDNFVDGKKDGESIVYSIDGAIIESSLYRNGRKVK